MSDVVEPEDALGVLRELAMPVVVVAAAVADTVAAAVATTMYASLRPPLLAVSLGTSSRTAAALRTSGQASVSILGCAQAGAASAVACAPVGLNRFVAAGVDTQRAPAGWDVPAVAGVAALWCTLAGSTPAGDHELFLLAPQHVVPASGGDLVRRHGGYHSVGASLDLPPDGYPL